MSDGPMARKLFIEMSPGEQEAYITMLQAQRLHVVRRHQEHQAALQQVQDARIKQQIADQLRMVERNIATFERALSAVETRYTKIMALRAMVEQGETA